MADYPNRNQESASGSDLPRPKRINTTPGSSSPNMGKGIQPYHKPSNPVNPGVQSGASRQNAMASNHPPQPSGSGQTHYGSDTMRFRAVQQQGLGEIDTEFERRRAAQAAPRPQQQRPKSQAAPPKKTQKRRRKKSFLGKIVAGVCVFLAVIFVIYSSIALLLITRLDHVDSQERTVTSGSLAEKYVTSILLIGTDARDEDAENGRSDSMILLSVNSRTKTIYLTSFMRDAYVKIPGHGSAKLNAAYSYGGAELLMDTLEYNYDISIDDYVAVSFGGFAGIIDAVGGVEITLSDAEAEAVNEILISEVNELLGADREDGLLDGGGTIVLDGKQALSYSRIRYIGNADFERTSRQREVMSKILSKMKSTVVTAVPKLVSAALPHMTTNMPTWDMYQLSLRLPFMAGYGIEQIQIPADDTWSGETVDGQSVLVVDFDENIELLEDTVYATSK